MTTRAAAAEATRERIVGAASDLFAVEYYDEVTLRRVALAAGVALQTVVNHFGTKEELLSAVVARFSSEIATRRDRAVPGDVRAAVTALVGDYEITGDPTLRALAIEDRVAAVRPAIAQGRASHRAWVERVLAAALEDLGGRLRRRRLAQLVTVTDVYAWKLLRRDHGLSRAETITAMTEMVQALHPPTTDPKELS